MECARPGQEFGVDAERDAAAAREDLLRATRHLQCGAASESQQQQPARIDAAEDQARDPMCQRLGLAGASSRRNQQRWRGSVILANAISNGTLLRRVQPLQNHVGGRGGGDRVPFLFHDRLDNAARGRRQSR